MKQNIIKKYKWYLFGAISVMLILSIGLSFCTWDNNTISSIIDKIGISNFGNKYTMGLDENFNNKADIGDTIFYGNYFQNSYSNDKTPLEWRVVDVRTENGKEVLYLLTEKVIAYGCMYGATYYGVNGEEINEGSLYTQDYMISTLNMWLNADYTELTQRSDGIANFTENAEKLAMRGFYKQAFSTVQQNQIISRTISGMRGYSRAVENNVEFGSGTYKVWVPSWTEIYGNYKSLFYPSDTSDGTMMDGLPNQQLKYFENSNPSIPNPKLIAKPSNFVRNPSMSNFSTDKDTSHPLNNSVNEGNVSPWRLRSASPSNRYYVMYITGKGVEYGCGSENARVGVRPAICLER